MAAYYCLLRKVGKAAPLKIRRVETHEAAMALVLKHTSETLRVDLVREDAWADWASEHPGSESLIVE